MSTHSKPSTKTAPKSPAKVDAASRRVSSPSPPANPGPAASTKNEEPRTKNVAISKAKGRPMLTWVGKRPLTRVTAFPAQHIETFDPTRSLSSPPTANCSQPTGLLYHGDNKEVLAHLLANGYRGKVNLVYIDPPFDSGADYVRKVTLRGPKGTATFDGEVYSLGEQIQYTDIWANDNYLQFMYERLMLLKELMSEDASIYLHCDPNRSYHLRCLLDEIFGTDRFVNEIVWKRSNPHGNQATRYGSIHDSLLFYSKGEDYYWNPQFDEHDQEYLDAFYRHVEEGTKRRYRLGPLNNFAGVDRPNLTYMWHGFHRTWRYTKERMQNLENQGRIVYSSSGLAQQKLYLDEMKGVPPQDLWLQIKLDISEYPTQKPEGLLSRVIESSCPPSGLVLDCFLGSGTTAAVAQKLGRCWIGCDINKGAIQITAKRLQAVISEQLSAIGERSRQDAETLPGMSTKNEEPGTKNPELGAQNPSPASLAFTVWRVNDYDLQIQHNEAVNLACEHLGVTRMRTDSFFDGTRGKALVKIVPFGHPLTPLDLEELKRELAARPTEERDILMVCLGKETAVDAWIEDWNRLRRKGEVPNRIDVLELRTDSKYGVFIAHQPASARVSVRRKGNDLEIEVQDFVSPTIIERLKQQGGVLAPQIDDWRAMVDCILIDPAYDGQVFNVVLSDIPEKKTDYVTGHYTLPAPKNKTAVAVKIVDMLGEEVIVTHEI